MEGITIKSTKIDDAIFALQFLKSWFGAEKVSEISATECSEVCRKFFGDLCSVQGGKSDQRNCDK